MADVTVPVRSEFRTSNPDETRELLDRMYGWHLEVEAMRRERFHASVTQVVAGDVVWAEFDLPVTVRARIPSADKYTFSLIKAGVAERFDGGPTFGRGDVFVGSGPEIEESARVFDVRSRAVQLPIPLLATLASGDPERPMTDLRFLARRPVHNGAARWNSVCRTFEMLVADPDRASAPLVVGPLGRLLAATALDAFPSTATARTAPASIADVQPSTVQRAIAFIEANPDLDISVTDIARAAYVTVRALQLAFRRQLDMTPTNYLRQVRLSHARRELQEASDAERVTITRVALKWGFSTSRRFSTLYRETYGESPRQTLER